MKVNEGGRNNGWMDFVVFNISVFTMSCRAYLCVHDMFFNRNLPCHEF